MPIYEVEFLLHRTETRHVVEKATITVEADNEEEARESIQVSCDDGNLRLVAEYEEVSTDDEGDEDDDTVEVISCEEVDMNEGEEPDLFKNR